MSTLPQDQVAPLEADYGSDGTSDYSESVSSSTASLSSSVLEHTYENGRRYHVKSSEHHMMPSDETELDRLDLTHHMELMLLGGELHLAPIKGDPHNVLDCGTGTGIWALDFGATHPGSQVIGVDLAPIQPTWTYPNVRFETDDLEKEWTYKKDYFDFIHSRMVGASIKDWPKYTKQMFEHCAPGGYVELCEHSFSVNCDDGTVKEDSNYHAYFNPVREGLQKLGTSAHLFNGEFFKKHLEDAGFVDVKLHTYKVAWGTWPKSKKAKELGRIAHEVFRTGAEAYGLLLMTRILGKSEEEARELCRKYLETIPTRKEHAYHFIWQVYGRKPETATSSA